MQWLKIISLSAVVAALGTACGAGTGVEVQQSSAARGHNHAGHPHTDKYGKDGEPDDLSTLTSNDHGTTHVEWTPAPNFTAFVQASDAAVVGRVTGIAPPRWNTRDGRDPGDTGLRFRDATLVVDDVVYDSADFPVDRGQTLTVRLYGDGSDSGPDVSGAGPVRKYNKISGPVTAGDTVLWVLSVVKFGMNDGTTDDVPKLVTDFFGSWLVDRATSHAKSIVPERTVPLQALVGKLRSERATPSSAGPNGKRGRLNPLE